MLPFALADKTQSYGGSQTVTPVAVSPTGTFNWDLKNQQNLELTLTSNLTMGAPVGWEWGKLVMVEVIQGGSGSYTLSWASPYKGISSLTLGTTVGSSNVLVFKCILGGYLSLVSNSTCTRS